MTCFRINNKTVRSQSTITQYARFVRLLEKGEDTQTAFDKSRVKSLHHPKNSKYMIDGQHLTDFCKAHGIPYQSVYSRFAKLKKDPAQLPNIIKQLKEVVWKNT